MPRRTPPTARVPRAGRALYELAHALGHPTQRWVEDLEGLPDGAVLVAMGGCLAEQRRPLSRYESERLSEWVRRGGTLMVFGAERYVPEDYPAHLTRVPGQCHRELLAEVLAELTPPGPDAKPEPGDQPAGVPEDVQPEAADPDPLAVPFVEEDLEIWQYGEDEDAPPVFLARAAEGPLATLGGVPMVQPAHLSVGADEAPETLAQFGERSAALALPMGAGRLVLVASASMLTNDALLEHRGGVVFARLLEAYAAPGAPVIFDEFHLGTGGTRSLVRYLRQVGVGAVLLQLLFLGGLWVLRSGRRLGELEEAPVPVPGGTVSYVAATAALYSRTPDRNGIARVLLIRALDRVATHHRVRVRQPEQLIAQLRSIGRTQAADACDALLLLFAEPTPSEKALVALSKRVDALVQQACAPMTPSFAGTTLAAPPLTSPIEEPSS